MDSQTRMETLTKICDLLLEADGLCEELDCEMTDLQSKQWNERVWNKVAEAAEATTNVRYRG